MNHKQTLDFGYTYSSSASKKGVVLVINLKSVPIVYARFAWFVCVLLLANFRGCWLLQRKDAHGGNCQVFRGLAQGWCSILYGCSGRESSVQRQGPRGFHSLHPRDSSALLCYQTPHPGDEWVMPGLQEARGDCSSDMWRTQMGFVASWLTRDFSVHSVGRQRDVLFHFAKIKAQAHARHCNL